MSRIDPVTEARLEGLSVEFEEARQNFMSAAHSTLENMRLNIIRDYPRFYSKRECDEAGVSRKRFWLSRLIP